MKKAVCVLVCLTLVGLALAANGKTEKSAKTEAPKPTKPVEDPKPTSPEPKAGGFVEMEVVDYLRSGALVVAFVVACFAGREKWLLGNTIVLGCAGAAGYFFPRGLLEYQVDGKVDDLHLYMAQQSGGWLIMMAVVTHFSRVSRSPTVSTSLLLARSAGGLMLVLCSLVDYMKQAGDKNKLNQNFMTFGFLFITLWTVGNIIYTFRSTAYVGGAVSLRNRVSVHVFIDTVLLLIQGMFYYAYPEHGYAPVVGFKIDGVHAHQMRSIGAAFFTYSLFGILSLFFTDDKDKRIYLLGRILTCICSLPVLMLYQWKFNMLERQAMTGMLVMIGAAALNLLLGYFHPIDMRKFLKRD